MQTKETLFTKLKPLKPAISEKRFNNKMHIHFGRYSITPPSNTNSIEKRKTQAKNFNAFEIQREREDQFVSLPCNLKPLIKHF